MEKYRHHLPHRRNHHQKMRQQRGWDRPWQVERRGRGRWGSLRWFIQLSLRHQLPPSFPLLLTQVTLRSSPPAKRLVDALFSLGSQLIFTRLATDLFSLGPTLTYFHSAGNLFLLGSTLTYFHSTCNLFSLGSTLTGSSISKQCLPWPKMLTCWCIVGLLLVQRQTSQAHHNLGTMHWWLGCFEHGAWCWCWWTTLVQRWSIQVLHWIAQQCTST